ncbi:MAG: hypothetical protein J0H40_01290 [Rhizobiales bacterium]|nr:hypothetical protein [Hyphomicrobiales bacterium]
MQELESLEARLNKRREVDMIVKMRVDQIQRENVFASPAALDELKRLLDQAIETIDALSKRLTHLEARISSENRG